MDKIIERIVVGKCPFCQGRLNFNGHYLYCENQDYKANAIAFDRIWDDFMTGKDIEKINSSDSDNLLQELRDLNGKDLEMKSEDYSRPECVFENCPNPSICKLYRCQHVANR